MFNCTLFPSVHTGKNKSVDYCSRWTLHDISRESVNHSSSRKVGCLMLSFSLFLSLTRMEDKWPARYGCRGRKWREKEPAVILMNAKGRYGVRADTPSALQVRFTELSMLTWASPFLLWIFHLHLEFPLRTDGVRRRKREEGEHLYQARNKKLTATKDPPLSLQGSLIKRERERASRLPFNMKFWSPLIFVVS